MIKLQSNPIQHLKLLKMSTFTDKYTFIDEILQNASRAKATKVDVEYSSQEVTISNNGKVLEDPQSLFSIAESNWDSSVASENPFGIGFFSTVVLFNKIEVLSGTHKIKFDVNECLNKGKLDIDHEIVESYEGFKVILSEPTEDLSYSTIRTKLEEIAKYTLNIIVTLDQEQLEQIEDPSKLPSNTDIGVSINEGKVLGFLTLHKYSWYSEIKLYYKGRFIKALNYHHIEGELHLQDNLLTLRAPDRKDIIRDEKFDEFTKFLNSKIKELVSLALSSDKISNYDDAVTKYMQPVDYTRYVKLHIIKTKEDETILNSFYSETGSNFKNFYSLKARDVDVPKEEEVQTKVELLVTREDSGSSSSGYYGGSSTSSSKSTITSEKMELEEYDNSSVVGVYVRESELRSYKSLIAKLRSLDVPIVVTSSNIETLVCGFHGILHISDMKDTEVQFKTTIVSEPNYSKSERRAVRLMNDIALKVLNKEVFHPADIISHKIINISQNSIESENKDFYSVSEDRKKVWVNPKMMKLDLTNSDSATLNIKDMKFYLKYAGTISSAIKAFSSEAVVTKEVIFDILAN